MQSIRVTSEGGTTRDVVVTLTETGQQIDRVKALRIEGESGEHLLKVELELWMPRLDVEAPLNVVIFTCPACYETAEHKCNMQSMSLP